MKINKDTVYMAACGIFEQAIEDDPWCDGRGCSQCMAYGPSPGRRASLENVNIFKRLIRLEPNEHN